MRDLILLAGAVMFAAAAPLTAKPGGGHGHGNSSHASVMHGNSGRVETLHGRSKGGIISTSHGRLYALDSRGSCPPGLAKRNNGCLPPGQAKKLFNVGQRYNRNFGSTWSYNQIPDYLRNQYSFDQGDRFYYNNGYLYQVDPKSMLIQQVVSALLR